MYSQAKKRNKNRKKLLISVVVFILAGALTGGYIIVQKSEKFPTKTSISKAKQTSSAAFPTKQPISIVATGDWIAHDTINAQAQQSDGTYNYSSMVADLKPYLTASDIRFCNDPILNGGKALGITGYPKFNSPAEFVTDMGRFGCNLVNTASNHSFDFSQSNISASVDIWKTVPNMLAIAGQNSSLVDHDAVRYFTVRGVKMAFIAYTTYINADAPKQNDYGVNEFSTSFASSQIIAAKAEGAKVIIASMRWGTEYSTNVTAGQQKDAQWLADQGVQIVLGHGSHELQPVQQLTGAGGNKTVVWYSLGNFLNTQIPPETLFNGLAYMSIDPTTFEPAIIGYLPLYVNYEWTAAQAAAEDTNARRNVHMYLLDKTSQQMINAQQLKTTADAQKQRMTTTLGRYGSPVPLLTSSDAPH